jgi:hypothetical protein
MQGAENAGKKVALRNDTPPEAAPFLLRKSNAGTATEARRRESLDKPSKKQSLRNDTPPRSGTAIERARRAGRRPPSEPPYPVGQTVERHRALEAQGYLVHVGKAGATVFCFGYGGC